MPTPNDSTPVVDTAANPAVAAAVDQVEQTQWLRLAAAERACAVPIASVREILQVGLLTPMPGAPAVVRGVMNLRGAVVPVIDLGERLAGRPVVLGRRSCIVVVEGAAQDDFASTVMGLLVDAVFEVMDVTERDITPAPALGTSVSPDHLAGICQLDGLKVQMLDLPRVISQADLAAEIGARAGPQTATAASRVATA